MIPANMFATDTQRTQQVGTFQFSKTFATALNNPGTTYIDNNDATFNNAYWLGWIRPENVPTALKISYTTYDSQADKFTFTDSTKLQNFNIGYCATLGNNYSDYHNASILKYSSVRDSIAEKWRCMPEGNEQYFTTRAMLNQFFVGCINYSRLAVVYTAVKAGIPYNTLKYIDAADFETWKTANVDIIVENGATKTISNAALNENNYIQSDGYNIFISAYRAELDSCKDSDNTSFASIITTPVIDLYAYGKLPNNSAITPEHEILVSGMSSPYYRAYEQNDYKTFEITELYGRRQNCVYYATSGYDSGHSNVVIDRRDGAAGNIFYAVVNGFVGEFESMLNKQQGSQIGGWSGFWPNGNTCFGAMAGTLVFCRMYTPNDIILHMSLMPRWKAHAADAASYGVVDGVYYPEVLDSGEFTGKLITGTAAELLRKLQPWQYESITENEYDSADLPPYYPPADEGENVGDKITRPATLGAGGTLGFITQYALRAADVTELGGLLWTSIFTTDYWKNYMFSLALDTGSLDLASILNFFISLRVYPFPLVNVPSYAQFGQDMYIGTGIMPLHFANNLHTINNYCDYVPGGSAVVDSGNFYHDWRDYTNTEIILYIPYCGTVQLNPGDVVGNTVSVQYAVDFATGGCIAYVDLETGDGAGYPIAALPGQMGADIPLTATAAGQVAARLAGDAMNVAHLIGGQIGNEIGVATGAAKGSYHPSLGSIGAAVGGPIGAAAGFGASLVPGLAGQAVNMLSRGAVSAPMLGGARGFASFGAPQTPYIQIRRGIYPDFGADIMGNATAGMYTVGDLSGFVSGEIKTDSLSCSDYEKLQIKQLISNGIYV